MILLVQCDSGTIPKATLEKWRERERQRETERQRDRHRETDRDRHRETDRDRDDDDDDRKKFAVFTVPCQNCLQPQCL